MITHHINADSAHYFTYIDADLVTLYPEEVTFEVVDDQGGSVISWTLADPNVISGVTYEGYYGGSYDASYVVGAPWSVLVRFPYSQVIAPGIYSYECRMLNTSLWGIVSAGLLRVR